MEGIKQYLRFYKCISENVIQDNLLFCKKEGTMEIMNEGGVECLSRRMKRMEKQVYVTTRRPVKRSVKIIMSNNLLQSQKLFRIPNG